MLADSNITPSRHLQDTDLAGSLHDAMRGSNVIGTGTTETPGALRSPPVAFGKARRLLSCMPSSRVHPRNVG
jgi:hypothetical protein